MYILSQLLGYCHASLVALTVFDFLTVSPHLRRNDMDMFPLDVGMFKNDIRAVLPQPIRSIYCPAISEELLVQRQLVLLRSGWGDMDNRFSVRKWSGSSPVYLLPFRPR